MKENMLNWTIQDIIKKYPETSEVFSNNGFDEFANEEVLNELGAILKLKPALRAKKIGAEAFLHLLEEKIADAANYDSLLSSCVDNNSGKFNFVAQIPCGLKVPLEREMQSVLQKAQENGKEPINYYTGACCNDLLHLNEWIPHFMNIDEVPDMVLTKGYHFFNKNFVERFVKSGYFAMPGNQLINSQIADIGITDKEGNYHVVGLTTTIMVVDKSRLGDLPMPRTWGDLLKSEYERKVLMNSYGDSFSDVVLLNIYKDYGEAGIEALGKAIHSGAHAAQMIKGMASSKADLPPIYIMSNFFANAISSSDNIEIVWPEDGALVMPLFFMVKADKAEKLNDLVDFVSGSRFGQLCADAYFPSLHPAVNNKLAANAKFKWLGCDFIKENDIEELVEKLNKWCWESYCAKGGQTNESSPACGCKSDKESLKIQSM
ncbi:hypothetical protein SPSIL_056540 [Sporomusa silvacetica DSM 10669]|uniref:DUF1858 domain-containing protein n=1 Tax=Sporomusa silvacetica DSM 10669 TaxID=1123289 RepID=A0ABZ3IV24_9FIRM|nr:ABC transporter substrate-binding protein [Sporomusa silvacetica]OZC12962.1 hypothetical protein SPSIL_56810 [Sporomusa silvacetica DSM 10669]